MGKERRVLHLYPSFILRSTSLLSGGAVKAVVNFLVIYFLSVHIFISIYSSVLHSLSQNVWNLKGTLYVTESRKSCSSVTLVHGGMEQIVFTFSGSE